MARLAQRYIEAGLLDAHLEKANALWTEFSRKAAYGICHRKVSDDELTCSSSRVEMGARSEASLTCKKEQPSGRCCSDASRFASKGHARSTKVLPPCNRVCTPRESMKASTVAET